jgi:hypothetical protein
MSMLRSNRRFATFLNDSGLRTYVITTRLIASGEAADQPNGALGFFLRAILTVQQ